MESSDATAESNIALSLKELKARCGAWYKERTKLSRRRTFRAVNCSLAHSKNRVSNQLFNLSFCSH